MKTTATPIARRVVSFALALLFVAKSPSAFALTETVNGVDWPYSVSSGGATLGGGSSSTPAIPKATSGAVEIPSELGGVPVTSIANYAFSGCSNAKTLKYGKAAKLAKCKFKAPKGRKFAG